MPRIDETRAFQNIKMQSSKEKRATVREQIIELYKEGKGAHDIARTVKCSKSTVRKYIQRYGAMGEEGLLDGRRKNKGKRKTSAEQDDALVSEVTEKPFQDAIHVSANLSLTVSKHTIYRRLREAGFRCHRPARKMQLLQMHRDDRVAFALQHLHYAPNDWDSVIFTGEKAFYSTTNATFKVWKPQDGSPYEERYASACNDSGRVTCSFWGWMSARGPGKLVEILPPMTSSEYVKLLQDVLLPSVREVYSEDDMPTIRLALDDSSVHGSEAVRKWFASHTEIEVLRWPAKSPDLNIMDNVWACMVKNWRLTEVARNRDTLVSHVMHAWDKLRESPEFFSNLARSVRYRINQVIDQHGSWTDF